MAEKIIGIVGAGVMGTGIAQVAAQSGHQVIIYDILEKQLLQSYDQLSSVLSMLESKNRLNGKKKDQILKNLQFTSDLNELDKVDVLIEAIIEKLEIKHQLYNELKGILSDQAILASNTSSFSITELAQGWVNPERFIGIHFFNPAPLMPLVEVIPGYKTNSEIQELTTGLIRSWGKKVVKAKDSPGFIVNKIARPYYSEALRMVEEGLVDKEAVDLIMEQKGFKMGPFTLMDFIGHDVNYAVTESVWKAFYYDHRYQPSHLQLNLVKSGKLGRKIGEGFYRWEEKKPIRKKMMISESLENKVFIRMMAMLVNEALDTAYRGIGSEKDIDLAARYGLNYPKGIIEWGKEIGYPLLFETLTKLYDFYQDSRYRTCPLLRKLTFASQ